MKGGFSFCGVDIQDVGLEYAPELEDTYVYGSATTKVYEETFDGHNGGYFYGASRDPKQFILRCFFEETVIDKGLFTKIQHLFKVGKSGKLIFKRRPWCYYYATVTEYDDHELSNYLNGIIKITMKAYYPFARCDDLYSLRLTPNHENIMENSALYDTDGMAPEQAFTNINLTKPNTFSFTLGNPGTERAALTIVAAGDVGAGVIIRNKTTDQEMKLVAMSKAKTTNVNKVVTVDGISGKTILSVEDGSDASLAFLYHDYGFIELAPDYPANRKIYITGNSGNNITVSNKLEEDYIDKYIYVNGWRKITDQPDIHTLTVDSISAITKPFRATIMSMNQLEVVPVTSISLDKLSFYFKPTFA